METKIFKTLDELHDEWEKNGACQAGKEFNYSCKSLEEVFRKCPLRFRLWRLRKGYLQFAEHCDWSKLDGYDWYKLLIEQPKFAEHCDWSKLDGYDWCMLLIKQPKFAEHCDWSKLDGYDWYKLLIEQPKFAEHCDWEKLNGDDWEDLLSFHPQFAKFKKQ